MDNTVAQLVDFYNKKIAENNKNKVLNLVGKSDSSIFLRTLDKKASRFGIVTVHNDTTDRFRTVIDIETCQRGWLNAYKFQEQNDIDKINHFGMSSVAQGVYEILKNKVDLEGKTILIIGRGHSVKGLAEALIKSNATVITAHSKTKNIEKLCDISDYIVTSTNNVDLSNFENKVAVNIQNNYPSGLGNLTTSIILYRAIY